MLQQPRTSWLPSLQTRFSSISQLVHPSSMSPGSYEQVSSTPRLTQPEQASLVASSPPDISTPGASLMSVAIKNETVQVEDERNLLAGETKFPPSPQHICPSSDSHSSISVPLVLDAIKQSRRNLNFSPNGALEEVSSTICIQFRHMAREQIEL